MTDIKTKVFKVLEYLKSEGKVSSQEQFGKLINENKQGVTDLKAGRKEFSLQHILLLWKAVPELNNEWLLTDDPTISMINSYSEVRKSNIVVNEPQTLIHRIPQVVTTDVHGNDNVVLVPVQAAAGYLNGYGDPKFIESLPAYNLPKINHGTFRMFQVKGHSMFPTIHEGAYVVGQFVENWIKEIKDDRVYVIVSKDDGVIVKRCLNRIKKYGHIYAKSDNRRDYPNMTIEAESVVEIWEYKMHLSYELPNPADLYDRVTDLEATVSFLETKLKKIPLNRHE